MLEANGRPRQYEPEDLSERPRERVDRAEVKKYLSLVVRGHDIRLLVASVVTGVLTAIVIAIFQTLTEAVALTWLFKQALTVLMLGPIFGIGAAYLLLRYVGRGTSSSTSDEFVRSFHDRHPRLPMSEFPGKMLAGITSMGFGAALGLEGPSVYAGSSLGLWVHKRAGRWLRRDEAKLLLTAGAAAGISAVFKAPATGVMFALETPYRDDVTPQALLPSLLASAASYATFVSLVGTKPVIPVFDAGSAFVANEAGSFAFGVRAVDLLGALLLGVAAGLGGRGFAWLVRRAKRATHESPAPTRLLIGGVILALLALVAQIAFGSPLTLGPGGAAMTWVIEGHGLGLIALLLGLRIAATVVSVYAGGVGGLFIPLSVQGLILGQFVGSAVGQGNTPLYPVLGLAAFLGAGYRVPITAVMFVAETTGGVGSLVVPALVAAAVSQVVAGPGSVSGYQMSQRLGHLERRFTLPLTSILNTDVLTVPPDATISEFVYSHVLGRRERVVPVVNDDGYQGMARLADISEIDREQWEDVTIGECMSADHPTARPTWTVRDAVAAMQEADVEVLAVIDEDGIFIGTVKELDILKLDEILDETGG